MKEQELDFWTELRFNITRSNVFDAYCDWIKPKSLYLTPQTTIIEGKIGFLTPTMEVYKMKLSIPVQIDDIGVIDSIKMSTYLLQPEYLDLDGDTVMIQLFKRY